jgi:hypothetical protein
MYILFSIDFYILTYGMSQVKELATNKIQDFIFAKT